MPRQVRFYVFFGLIASGKSTLAQAWAEHIGATYWNSDVVRKELAGLAAEQKAVDSFNQGIYSAKFSQKTYDKLLFLAQKDIDAHRSVVLDASYQEQSERRRVIDLAGIRSITPVFILCRCPEPIMKERMALRAQDPNAVSDGRWEIYLKQKDRFQHPSELAQNQFLIIDTDDTIPHLIDLLKAKLQSYS